MNPIKYCRRVAGLLGNYNREADGYDRDKYLVGEDRKDALLTNGCLPELIEDVSPQQVADYITDTIREGRDALEAGGRGEFEVRGYPKLILLLLATPGLAKLIKSNQ